MLLAMLDASVTRAVSPVYWAALLLVGAMAVALWRSPRRRRGRVMPRTGDDRMTLHTTLGMVAMAALQVGMHGAAVTVAAGTHSHHGGGGLLQAALLAGAIAYAAFTVLLVRRAHGLLDRAQFVAMGASVALMAIGTLL
jgi:hypothetical protein